MPCPKIFISSTCYDLSPIREQLRSFITKLGYEPILSEYSDILYDPRVHTHTSCVKEVPNVDMLILIIGSRFGGKAVPEAINSLDIENLIKANFDVTTIDGIENFSITQLEVLKAIDSSIPVFTFIDNKVMHEQLVYKKNKEFSDKIFYPSIDNQESARYIFEFIDILRRRNVDNAVLPFNSIADIE